MKLLSRREYNLILRALDKYDVFMNKKEKELRDNLEDKLYYNPVSYTHLTLPTTFGV